MCPALLLSTLPYSDAFFTCTFSFDSAGLSLRISIIQNLHMVSSRAISSSLSLPRVRPKECEHFFFSGDAKQTLRDTYNVMRSREHGNSHYNPLSVFLFVFLERTSTSKCIRNLVSSLLVLDRHTQYL